jgi:general stress protein YciG
VHERASVRHTLFRKEIPMPNSHEGTEHSTSHRGFASMDAEKQREIASRGGRAAHATGRAHQFSADEAREAGKKGGEKVSRDRHHMAEIGRLGGIARGRRLSEPPAVMEAKNGSAAAE